MFIYRRKIRYSKSPKAAAGAVCARRGFCIAIHLFPRTYVAPNPPLLCAGNFITLPLFSCTARSICQHFVRRLRSEISPRARRGKLRSKQAGLATSLRCRSSFAQKPRFCASAKEKTTLGRNDKMGKARSTFHTLSFRARPRNLTVMLGRPKGGLPLAKGAAERSKAEGFAPTDMRSEF